MYKTEEFIDVEKIRETRLNKSRNNLLDFLWNDFFGAVEKVINVLSEEELAGTFWIIIKYKIRKNGKTIYRSKYAETDWSGKRKIKYESEDIILGSKLLLERPFRDFRTKAEQDIYCSYVDFEIEELFETDGPGEAGLDFNIGQIETIPKKAETSKYKIVSE